MTRAAAALLTMVTGAAVTPADPAAARPGATAAVAARDRDAPGLQTLTLSTSAAARPRTDPFSLIGVTWADPTASVDGVVQVRTRAVGTGAWSAWKTLEADGGAPADLRGSTDPLWVGPSDGVEARVTGAGRPLPADLRVDLINPDAEQPTATQPTAAPAPQQPAPAARKAGDAKRTVTLPARPVPRMVTRAGWRADESIVKGAPEYTGPIQAFFVHHTASGNGYSCAQSAGIVRGIQAYQVRSRGWDDIGYNFLIDKCGTIFEGRAGGVGRSVLGAHTLGFNTDSSAIAVIGTYGAGGVSASVRTAIATMAAYKLGAAGNLPSGKVVLTSSGGERFPAGTKATFHRIAGHRDAGQTACPGNALYAQLPAIRAIAGAAPAGFRLLRTTGAATHGNLLFTKGVIRPVWTLTTPSALIDRFEVWVDGVLTHAAPGAHRTAAISLSPGGHTVTIKALHLSGRSTTLTRRVVSDATAPVFGREPEVVLRPGSLNGSVPVRLGWQVGDVNGLSSVRLVAPSAVDLGTTATSRDGTAKPARPATFTVRATDRAGNVVDASVTRTPMVLSEAVSQRTGTWRTLRSPAYLGGVALGAAAAGASATWTFSGSSVALGFTRGPRAGRVRIVVDGVSQGIVDLRSTAPMHRQAVWSRWWTESGQHTVRVEIEGTAGRPGVAVDGLVYLK